MWLPPNLYPNRESVLGTKRGMMDSHLSIDTLFDLLGNQRRRYLLYALDQQVESVATLDELVALILEWERRIDGESEQPTDEREKSIRLSLHHKHLPRLEELDLLEYDSRSRTIRNRVASSDGGVTAEGRDEVPHLRSLICSATE